MVFKSKGNYYIISKFDCSYCIRFIIAFNFPIATKCVSNSYFK